MNAPIELRKLKDKDVTCHYDVHAGVVSVEYGRVYEDLVEAELFGDHLADGTPSGLRFEGVSNYLSSNRDNLQIGYLVRVEAELDRCKLELGSEAPELAGEVSFSFKRVMQLVARRKSSLPKS